MFINELAVNMKRCERRVVHDVTDDCEVDGAVVVVGEGVEVDVRSLGRLHHLPVQKLLHFGPARLVNRLS